jgi:sulfite exporter TauE/SafE
LLQSALLVAALTNHVAGGALVMAGFALASSLGLGAAPLLLARFAGLWGGREHGVSKISVRLSGLVLAIASAWALIHGLWEQIAAYCAV